MSAWNFQDLTGMKFGRLLVLGIAYIKKVKGGTVIYWRCECDCGKEVIVAGNNLKRGNTKSCSCLRNEGNHTTHGLSYDKIYLTWNDIRQRCYNPNRKNYYLYGGRGIAMHEPWIDNFQLFYEYVSKLEHFGEAGYSLDRIDNDGDYCPGNLKWSTKSEQARNRRTNCNVEYQGEQMCLKEAAEKSGINYGTLQMRYKRGDRGDKLFRPIEEKYHHKKS